MLEIAACLIALSCGTGQTERLASWSRELDAPVICHTRQGWSEYAADFAPQEDWRRVQAVTFVGKTRGVVLSPSTCQSIWSGNPYDRVEGLYVLAQEEQHLNGHWPGRTANCRARHRIAPLARIARLKISRVALGELLSDLEHVCD